MFAELLICLLSVLLGMTIMWLIFLLRDAYPHKTPKPKEICIHGIQDVWIDGESTAESIQRNVKNIFSIPNYKFLIAALFAIGLAIGIFLGYMTMQEVNKDIRQRQQESHISCIIDDSQNNIIISKGGDFVEEKHCI